MPIFILFAFNCPDCYIDCTKGKIHMKNIVKYIAIILGIIIADQITKAILLWLILGHVPVAGAAWSIVPVPYLMAHVWDWFNIVFTWNPGASFSMFRTLGEIAPMVIIVLTGFIIGFIGVYMCRRATGIERLPLALIIGGALGNLIDRIRFGAVIDFLDFHIGGWHYPSFNVADICISIGVLLYIFNLVYMRKKCKCNISGEK